MGATRLFLLQDELDEWLRVKEATLVGETLRFARDGRAFVLKTAVQFSAEVAGEGDSLGLVGLVKDLDEVIALGGDYSAGSVIVGDAAYDVVEGFVALSPNDVSLIPPPKRAAQDPLAATTVDPERVFEKFPTTERAASANASSTDTTAVVAVPNDLDLFAKLLLSPVQEL